MNLDNIPEELRQLHQWVCYKKDKHPRMPSGDHASTTDSTTYSSFDEVCKVIQSGEAIGPGIVLTEKDPYTIIDLDGVIDEDGNIDPEAQEIVDRMDSYTEVSLSGRGIHIIIRATKQGLKCRKKNIEVYDKWRYIALTGNLWQDRGTIEDRQEEEEWLCSDVFGADQGQEPVEVEDLVLDRAAKPPTRITHLLRNKKFKKAWNYEANLSSMSDYDWYLASKAVEDGWEDQDVANLIIAFRCKHGGEDDLKKALRSDYIKRTLVKIKQASQASILGQLGWEVRKAHQFGLQDAEIDLILARPNGEEFIVRMGTTAQFLSLTHAKSRLYEKSFLLPKHLQREDKWAEITTAILPMIEIRDTTDIAAEMQQCLFDYLGDHSHIPLVERETLCEIFYMKGFKAMAKDDKGRVYLRLSDISQYARAHLGSSAQNERRVSHIISTLGWRKDTFRNPKNDDRSITLWFSPAGFVEA